MGVSPPPGRGGRVRQSRFGSRLHAQPRLAVGTGSAGTLQVYFRGDWGSCGQWGGCPKYPAEDTEGIEGIGKTRNA